MSLLNFFLRRRRAAAELRADALASLRSQEAAFLELQRELERRQVVALHELGGFDTAFSNGAHNWARQAELLLDFKRRIEALEQRAEE